MALISSTAVQITPQGPTAPTFQQIFDFLVAKYQGIFGNVYLGPDTQEGEFLGVIASAINDGNAATIAVYRSFSPATAVGDALSSNVRINGLERAQSSFSTCDVLITGVAGTTITNGQVGDLNDNKWNLPTTVVIPPAGQITVTSTCTAPGAVSANPGDINQMLTPTRGWQSVRNLSSSAPGEPVEEDATLRIRQSASVALPSLSIMDGIVAAVQAVPNVSVVKAYINDTADVDGNGLPAHAIALVVEGGDANAIAAAIAKKKTPGVPTAGTTTISVSDTYGTRDINFYRPTTVPIAVTVTLTALQGYNTIIGGNLSQAVVDYINALGIGQSVRRTRLFTPASLYGTADSLTYEINDIQLAGNGASLGDADINVGFDQLATCQLSDVTIVAES